MGKFRIHGYDDWGLSDFATNEKRTIVWKIFSI